MGTGNPVTRCYVASHMVRWRAGDAYRQPRQRASTEPFPAFSGFRYRPALPYEAGVSRRDPSPVLRAGGRYHVWYSRSTHDASGYWATIWYATSADGLHWVERAPPVQVPCTVWETSRRLGNCVHLAHSGVALPKAR